LCHPETTATGNANQQCNVNNSMPVVYCIENEADKSTNRYVKSIIKDQVNSQT